MTGPNRVLVSLALPLVFWIAACGASKPKAAVPDGDPLQRVSAGTLFSRGEAFARRGDLSRAEQYLSAALDRGYPPRRALPLLIGVCARASRYRSVLTYAEPYLESHPREWRLRLVVASIHLAVGSVDRARDELTRVVSDAPAEPTGHYMLAVLLRDENGGAQDAATHFQRYLELAPHGPHADEARSSILRLAVATQSTAPTIDPASVPDPVTSPPAQAPAPPPTRTR